MAELRSMANGQNEKEKFVRGGRSLKDSSIGPRARINYYFSPRTVRTEYPCQSPTLSRFLQGEHVSHVCYSVAGLAAGIWLCLESLDG